MPIPTLSPARRVSARRSSLYGHARRSSRTEKEIRPLSFHEGIPVRKGSRMSIDSRASLAPQQRMARANVTPQRGSVSRDPSPAKKSSSGSVSIAPPQSRSRNPSPMRAALAEEAPSNIKVYVRCRARNEREVAENSSVVISTSGDANGKELFVQGNNIYTNKTYTFDHVFGPESDQSMVYKQVATNVLKEFLGGFNCTIFAYGQTGTGKTYTMTGDLDITARNRPSPNAGIIPRVLHQLFQELEDESGEFSVKVSYIELYNEELRDLIAVDDTAKVKIYDDVSKKSVVIHGMEEAYIRDFREALDVLRHGAMKRQVASTKCNDHSSRSHSVFTITTHIKEVNQDGEEFVRVGKLNLVDLAGSENILRSGADNKRAREAGMINQSLLTLGRVINSLVERSSHVPYRESKLTRILQDSLGGGTKTCIVATVSPAKVSLEETLSTLEYASRAARIKNKPTANQSMSKQAHILEFVAEIEKLRAELNSMRQKEGVYLNSESYEALINESESRRVLAEEQKMRLDVVEKQLEEMKEERETYGRDLDRVKDVVAQKEHELASIRHELKETSGKLVKTKEQLASARGLLDQERIVSAAHAATEKRLFTAGTELMENLGNAVSDIEALQCDINVLKESNVLNSSNVRQLKESIDSISNKFNQTTQDFSTQFDTLSHLVERKISAVVTEQKDDFGELSSLIRSQFESVRDKTSELEAGLERSETDVAKLLNAVTEECTTAQSNAEAKLSAIVESSKRHSQGLTEFLRAFGTQASLSYQNFGEEVCGTFKLIELHNSQQGTELKEIRRQVEEMARTIAKQLSEKSDAVRQTVDVQKEEVTQEANCLKDTLNKLIDQMISARISSLDHLIEIDRRNTTQTSAAVEGQQAGITSRVEQAEASVAEVAKKAETKGQALSASLDGVTKRTEEMVNTAAENIQRGQAASSKSITEGKNGLSRDLEKVIESVANTERLSRSLANANRERSALAERSLNTTQSSLTNYVAKCATNVSKFGQQLQTQVESDIRKPVMEYTSKTTAHIDDLLLRKSTIGLAEIGQLQGPVDKKVYSSLTTLPRTESREKLLM
ncbi:kinesin-like protein Kip1p [Trichomonascus vanleenenianus]|uniref:kinesin-like protein Kip1p n=1 Tax=Trichomonascus vanleenenianus TaxID=2268995 RepID=UPI003ECB1A39